MKNRCLLFILICLCMVLCSCSNDNEVDSIRISQDYITILQGTESEIQGIIEPGGLKEVNVSWQSSSENVATVSGETLITDGISHAKIKGITPGNSTIIITSKNGKTNMCNVEVRAPIEVESISLSNNTLELIEGKEVQLTAKVEPYNADYSDIEWNSLDENIAIVSDGVIKALKSGKTDIIAKTSNGKSAKCELTIREEIKATSISFDNESYEVFTDRSITIKPVIEPAETDNKEIIWNSQDSSIATISNGTVKGIKNGETIITAQTANGLTASCRINVVDFNDETLSSIMKTQPLYVSSTKYIIQDSRYKSLYPDLLSAVIYNNSDVAIRNAIVAYVAWDSNNLPVKIKGSIDFSDGSYIKLCDFSDINLTSGKTYGTNKGLAIDEDCNIKTFKACVVSYEDFNGNTWENPYYEDWKATYENTILN